MLEKLFALIFPTRGDEAVARDISEEEFLALLDPTLIPKTNPATVALLPYTDRRVRSVLHEAKYHGTPKAFTLLGAALVEYIESNDDFDHPTFCIIPIPLGSKRLRERGYNQAEEIAKYASKKLTLPIETKLLVRTRETISQVSLPRFARARNMRGAFGATRRADPAYTYIVLDDVTTTGATLQGALSALASAGATNLIPIALAH